MNTFFHNCSTGEVRLEMSLNNATTNSQEGRLELCINNAWGTVCDSLFDADDAAVACSQIAGFSQQGNFVWRCQILSSLIKCSL